MEEEEARAGLEEALAGLGEVGRQVLARRVELAIDKLYGLYAGRMDYETTEEYLVRATRHIGARGIGELLEALGIPPYRVGRARRRRLSPNGP